MYRIIINTIYIKGANKIANEHNDPVVSQVHTKTVNAKQALIGEQKAIDANGGAGNEKKNYNKVNSPGKKLMGNP